MRNIYENHDVLVFYVFDTQLLEYTSWDTTTVKYIVLKQYEFSLQDLRHKDWIIEYP